MILECCAFGSIDDLFFVSMWYVVMAAFSDPTRFVSHTGLLWLPEGFSLAGFRMYLELPV